MNLLRFPYWAALALSLSGLVRAQTLTWDANTALTGVQNGSGTWNLTNSQWWDGSANTAWVNGANAIAVFGTPEAVSNPTVSIAEDIQLKEIRFLRATAATSIASGQQYILNGNVAGRVIDFGENGLIQIEDLASGGSQFINLGANLRLKGSNLRIQKYGEGTAFSFLTLATSANPDLTGSLTIGGSVYVTVNNPNAVQSVDRVAVEIGGTAALGGASPVYSRPFELAGFGTGLLGTGTAYGAIRFTAGNTQITGPVTLTADAGVHTNFSGANGLSGIVISGAISDNGQGFAFHRFAFNRGNGTLALTGANTYGGATVLGRAQSSFSGGITLLDFTAATAPQDDILYHGLDNAGPLELIGGNSATVLRLIGSAGETHSQRFGDWKVSGTYSVVELQDGAGGAMWVNAGAFSRTDKAALTVIGPTSGALSTTQEDGFLGPWFSYQSRDGARSWARIQGGVVGAGFAGEVMLTEEGMPFVGGHLGIASDSPYRILQNTLTSDVKTLSMNDDRIDHVVPVGESLTLRFGEVGGVQIVAGARSLTLGVPNVLSTITAGGGVVNTAGQLFLSNHSDSSLLTVHSRIANNGTGSNGPVSLIVNGATGSRTVLTAANTYTGGTTVASGILEIQNAAALGTTGAVTVVDGATLALSGDLTVTRALNAIAGFGDGNNGALRSISGVNAISGTITQSGPSLLTADAGSVLLIQRATAAPTTDVSLNGSYVMTFGGEGTIEVNSRISISSSGVVKTGSGLLILAGDNLFTGANTISQGVVRIRHANALGTSGTSYGSTTVASGAALEMEGGITVAEPITLTSAGVNNSGGIRNISGDNTLTGVITINAGTVRIHSDSGLLTLGLAGGTSNATLHSSTGARTLIFGGAGDIHVVRPLARTSTGAFTVTKEGAGDLTLAAAVNNTATTVSAGVMKLDFAGAASPASNILGSASTLNLNGGKLLLSGKAGQTNTQTVGALTVSGTYSEIDFEKNGAASLVVSVGDVTRSWAGILAIGADGSLRATGSLMGVADDNPAVAQALAVDGRVYAVIRDPVAGDDWAGVTAAVSGARNVVKLSALGLHTPSTADSLVGHADIASGVTTTTLAEETTINSLRFGVAQATTIARTGTPILNTGGILVSSTVGAFDSVIVPQVRPTPSTVSNPELNIIQNNTQGALILQNGIINRTETSRSTVSVTKSGPGLLVIGGASTFSGNLRLYEGAVQFAAGSAVSASMEFMIGSGSRSGRVILGDSSGKASLTLEYITTVGTGTDNRIVGGSSAMSRLSLTGSSTTSNFIDGYLGGPGPNEDQLEFRLSSSSGRATLGPDNTYAGVTILSRGILEVTRLADTGSASSLGTGLADPVIQMADATTGTAGSESIAVLRYIGSEDSVTNRSLYIHNSDIPADMTKVMAVLENVGTGTLKFTSEFTVGGSNTVGRILKLDGTNTGLNEVVGIGEISAANATSVIKAGTGTWAITGGSQYTGGTEVLGGRLLVTGTSGSATGLGSVTVAPGALLGGTGMILPAPDASITLNGATLQVGLDLDTETTTASTLILWTSGSGATQLLNGSVLAFDLFSGAGLGDQSWNAEAADQLMVGGTLFLGEGAVLRVGNPNQMDGWAEGDTWRLFDWSSLIDGTAVGEFSSFELPALPTGLIWDTSALYSDGLLAVALVPEPGRVCLLGLGLLSLLLRRKRRE